MEKINIAKLLEDCPKGMELDCLLWDNVTFERVADDGIWIKHIDSKSGEHSLYVYNDGSFPIHNLGSIRTKCVIFPKGKTTWEGFQRPFKDGDIVTWENRGSLVAFIYKERKDVAVFKHHFALYTGSLGTVTDGEISLVENEIVFATEEEKQKLFDAIKANGYRWNPETKTLEKLVEPKFKVGDRIKEKGTNAYVLIKAIKGDKYQTYYETLLGDIPITAQDNWELVPRFKKGDNVKHKESGIYCTIEDYAEGLKGYHTTIGHCISDNDINNWELVSNKFDISTLIPFESKVLVRSSKGQSWTPAFFGRKCKDNGYMTTFGWCQYCIPFEPNIHLMGTTQDCSNFYKTWE